mmetsp:Transcript_19457/g.28841  ORF Transcript_19457/g.28841 Transcript_19457/m.28841 type:complete len:202 (+) Transcript_19457:71-676(+)
MPKVTRAGKSRKAAAGVVLAKSKATPVAEIKDKDDKQLSRGQRKRQAKKEQYLKRQNRILSSLSLRKKEDQSKRIDGLDALKEALQAMVTREATDIPADTISRSNELDTNKAKKRLTAKEVSHLGLVMEHPEFKSNPFATIQEHLKNTLANQAELLKKESKIRSKQLAAEEEQRKKAKKEKLQDRGGKHRKKFHAARRGKH